MCQHGPSFIVVPPRFGHPNSNYRTFDWISAPFQIQSGGQIFTPRRLTASEVSERNGMVQLLSNPTLVGQIMSQVVGPTTESQEGDGFILNNGQICDPQLGPPGRLMNFTNPRPIPSHPTGTTLIGYIHAHPRSGAGMRAPTPHSDWGPANQTHLKQIMVESTCNRAWGMIQPNVAVILGRMESSSLNGLDPTEGSYNWGFIIS
jgi:hypothetical protein